MSKILIIEDDPKMHSLYNRAFKFAGYEIENAMNGQEGIDKLKSFTPDIILLDIMMPKKNGMEVLEEIQADQKLSKIPVIMLTNIVSGTRDRAEEAVKMGAIDYIIKSDYDPKQVVEKINGVLKKN